jgi:iron complex transport system ATP-binding protein
LIVFEAVHSRYPGAREDALQGVTLDAPAGQITAVVGPNGSGKSTLVRTLLRRPHAAAGNITVNGANLTTLDERQVARRCAIVPQREDLVFPLTVREYIALGRFPHTSAWRAENGADVAAIDAAVARTDVTSLLERRIDGLSGGEWQRARLARALAQGSPALVLDEPTTFLDIAHEMAVFELLDALARSGQAVLLVSHQLNLVARFADHIVLLHHGIVAASGAPHAVMQGPVLERVYEWPLVVSRDPAVGAPVLVPLRGRGAR